MAGHLRRSVTTNCEPIYLPIMPGRSTRHAAERDCYNATRYVPTLESRPQQERGREGGDAQSLQAWRGRHTAGGDRAGLGRERGRAAHA